ncbi:chloride channel protein [Eilatimonas milleporae]|uniref:CIC family chloride channel protein n=1 Tax=Eilatimonas milleporae TaxID=911205 RepID=A0A3M0CS59_9PROT|nr:chloride channel protein [Eilatimonas milleporae]RMB11757.1 CIC family chloride channel protein [Eilatimonas milleporae]
MNGPRDSSVTDHLRRFVAGGRRTHAVFLILAALTGLAAGYAAIGFYLAIDILLGVTYGVGEAQLATGARGLAWWHLLLVPTLGGLVIGQVIRFIDGKSARGVPDVIEAAALRDGRVDLKDGLMSAAATIASLGVGASTGREGPVVHLGATLSSALSEHLHLNPPMRRTLLGCGVAAAVAASFNAPIAGVFFALEVILGHYALHAFAPIVVSAIAGTLVSRAHLGDYPAFAVAEYASASVLEFPAFILLGLLSAGIAIIFMRSISITETMRERYLASIPVWLLPGLAGLLIGLISLVFPEILSVGYEATNRAINGAYDLSLLIPLILAKIAATTISLVGRFAGGVFSPSLFIGAMAGASFGLAAAKVFPALASEHGLYAIVGMGAVTSAVLGAPISTSLIVFEITGDYKATIAVMTAAAVASLCTRLFNQDSFFHSQLVRRGVYLVGGRASYLLRSSRVADHMTRDFATLQENTPLHEARARLFLQGGSLLVITDTEGHMTGTLSLSDLPTGRDNDDALNQPVSAFMSSRPNVKASDALEVALKLFDTSGEDILTVTSPSHKGVVVGLVRDRDVMRAYNRALLESQGNDDGVDGTTRR